MAKKPTIVKKRKNSNFKTHAERNAKNWGARISRPRDEEDLKKEATAKKAEKKASLKVVKGNAKK